MTAKAPTSPKWSPNDGGKFLAAVLPCVQEQQSLGTEPPSMLSPRACTGTNNILRGFHKVSYRHLVSGWNYLSGN